MKALPVSGRVTVSGTSRRHSDFYDVGHVAQNVVVAVVVTYYDGVLVAVNIAGVRLVVTVAEVVCNSCRYGLNLAANSVNLTSVICLVNSADFVAN